jgi:hypothetical protein
MKNKTLYRINRSAKKKLRHTHYDSSPVLPFSDPSRTELPSHTVTVPLHRNPTKASRRAARYVRYCASSSARARHTTSVSVSFQVPNLICDHPTESILGDLKNNLFFPDVCCQMARRERGVATETVRRSHGDQDLAEALLCAGPSKLAIFC